MKAFVMCCFQRTNYPTLKTDIFFLPIEGALEKSTLWKHYNLTSLIGAMAIAPYGFFENLKHYNLTYFSQKLFFNVKIIRNIKR